MKSRIFWLEIAFVALLAIGLGLNATSYGDGLDPKTLEGFRQSCNLSGTNRAIYNAATGNSLAQLTLNREILQNDNALFSNTVKVNGITNQKGSERCWLFGSLNVLRPEVMKKYKIESFQFSENYLAFWDKMEKANCFLEYMIELADRDPLDREMSMLLKKPIQEGGWWDYTTALIEKYGVVPADAMPEAANSENSALLFSLLQQKLRVDAVTLRKMKKDGKPAAELQAAKKKMLEEVYRMVVLSVGEPPQTFVWRYADKDGKSIATEPLTPQQFYKDKIGIDLSQYVCLMHHPMHPYQKHYVFARTRNMIDGKDQNFLNVDIGELKEFAVKAICDNQPVCFAADVTPDQDRGIMAVGLRDYESLFGVKLSLDKTDAMLMRQSTSNHVMVFVAVDLKDGKPVKWKVENSWGAAAGKGGYWHLYDNWFDKYVYCLVIRKAYLPAKTLQLLEEEPTVIPMWDPLAE
jgi:bleomycin hydrolase